MPKEYRNTKQWEEWLNSGGRNEGKDHELTVPFPIDIGCGVNKMIDGNKWISTREYGGEDKKYLKTVTLEITSWRGISAGAVHYYGMLRARGVEFEYPTESSRYGALGYGVPDYLEPIKVELTRVLTQQEIDQNPKRWEHYNAGDNVIGFDTQEEVIERGKEVFNRLFPKGWKFVVKKSGSIKITVIKR